MSDQYSSMAVEIAVAGSAGADFSGLANSADSELHVGPVREDVPKQDLFFDLGAIAGVINSVTAVITGIGGAAQVIDWIIAKLRDGSAETVVLKSGATVITVKKGNDPEEARKLLQAALKLV